jgi:hypothetical protein
MESTTGNRAVLHDKWVETCLKCLSKADRALPVGGYGARLTSLEVGKCTSKCRNSSNDVLHKTIVESNNNKHMSEKGVLSLKIVCFPLF